MTIYELRDLIAPLGFMFLLIPLLEFGIKKGGNGEMLAMLLMYISYVITYFGLIKPRLNKKVRRNDTK